MTRAEVQYQIKGSLSSPMIDKLLSLWEPGK